MKTATNETTTEKALKEVINHLESDLKKRQASDIRKLLQKDASDYQHVLQLVKAGKKKDAVASFRDLDTAARDYIVDYVCEEEIRKGAAKYFGFTLLKRN